MKIYRKCLAIGIIILFVGVIFGASVESSCFYYDNICLDVPEPLSCDANGPYEGNIMEDIEFEGTATGGIPPYEYFWDYGDGNTSSGDPHPTHNYANAGNYTVILTVIDSENDTASDTTWAYINAPPNAPSITVPETVRRGKLFTVEVVTIDPDGDDVYYRHKSNGCISDWFGPCPSGEKYSFKMSIIGAPGAYTIGVQAKDIHDAESEWAYAQINLTKDKTITSSFLNLLQNHPNLFPILRQLLGL